MAPTEKKQIWFWSSNESGPMPIRTRLMAGSQGIAIPGSPLETNASGVMELSDTDDTVLYGFFAGVVDMSTTWPITAALTANDKIRVAVARRGDIFGVYCDSGGTDSAVAQANVGNAYAVTVSASAGEVGYTTCDIGDATGTLFTVVNIASNVEPALYTTSDNPGVALVRISGTLQG